MVYNKKLLFLLILIGLVIILGFTLKPKSAISDPGSNLTPQVQPQTPVVEEPKVEQVVADKRATLIDSYFTKKKMPLAGYGQKFVAEADKNGLDWRLLAAISVKESSGGKQYPRKTNNPFGWDSARMSFSSINHAIEFVSEKLGHGRYYRGKTTVQKLKTYNPPSISPHYSDSVIGIMKQIHPTEKVDK